MALLPNPGRQLPNSNNVPVNRGRNYNLLSYKQKSVSKIAQVANKKYFIGMIVGSLGVPSVTGTGFYWK